MIDGCDKQMVLLVMSLITQIQSAMKSELCLVKATQSGDKFILHAIDFDREKVWAFVKKRVEMKMGVFLLRSALILF